MAKFDLTNYQANNIYYKYSPNILHSIVITFQNIVHDPLILPIVLGFTISFLVFGIIRQIFVIWKNLEEEAVLLELTPPAFTDKTAYTTQKLFEVIHALGKKKSLFGQLINRKTLISLEIVSTRNSGIRYFIRTSLDKVEILKKDVIAYLPQVRVKEVEEYLPDSNLLISNQTRIIEWKQTKHWAYPLANQDTLSEHDPVAFITGQMTKPSSDELIVLQLIISPLKTNETNKIMGMILHNQDVLKYLDEIKWPWFLNILLFVIRIVWKIFISLVGFIMWGIQDFVSGGHTPSFNQADYQNIKLSPRIMTETEKEIVGSIQQKVKQPLFETSMRFLVSVKEDAEVSQRVDGFTHSFSSFSAPNDQGLNVKANVLMKLVRDRVLLLNFRKRLLSYFDNKSTLLLSASEISDIYHFPYKHVTQTENLVKSYSKELPAPISLKQDTKFDVIFAKNTYGDQTTMIGLTSDQRARHMVVFGGTGNGKTTLILEMMAQDMINGKGIGFIDPHGDAAEKVLMLVPKEREDDVVYIDPYDIDRPIALNLMELTPGLSINDTLREKEQIAESIISLFRRVCSNEFSQSGNNAFRIEDILLNSVYTAFYIKNCTLFTIYDLLVDPKLLKETVGRVDNERLQNFWKNQFGKAGDFQIIKMVAPVTARIGKFLHSESARRILEQPHSSINFDKLMNDKKILIFNLSKGKLGENISQVLGTAIITKIQLAAMRRAIVPEDDRVPFYLYVDEFQNYATQSFVNMLAEARKYKLNIIIVEQSTSQQQDPKHVDNILANASIVICFRTGNPEDENVLLGQFAPFVKPGEIMNLPWFHFFIKIYAQYPQEPFSGQTIPLSVSYDKEKLERTIKISQEKYTTVYTPQIIESKEEIKDPPINDGNEKDIKIKKAAKNNKPRFETVSKATLPEEPNTP